MFRDAHVDFDRCKITKDLVVSGRIFAKIGWLETTEDNALFRSWYRSMERWIKTRYRRVHRHWWVGPVAETWSRQGGRLALGNELAMQLTLAAP